MIRKIIIKVIGIIEKVTGKRIVLIDSILMNKNNTAALSKYGFWIAGNVYNMSDISYGIATKGIIEGEETALVIKILDHLSEMKKISVYDIGANSGYYSMLSASMYREKADVYSFEPLIEYIDCIKKSVYLNRLNNVKIFEVGAGNKNGEKTMYLAGTGSTFEKGFSGDRIKRERVVTIKRIDDIIHDEKICLPDFIKIDVEGHELKVLEGAENAIKENLPVLFIEISHRLKNIGRSYMNHDYKKTFDFLEKIGYEAHVIRDGKICRFDSAGKPDSIDMYLFLHKDKHENLKEIL